MYNRYSDVTKFVTDPLKLQIVNRSEVYISSEENYDIVVDLQGHTEEFERLKPFIICLAKHICELDNLVQRFYQKKRVKNGGRGYVCLPSPVGCIRLDYLQSMENDPAPQNKLFPFELAIIYVEGQNRVIFDYWCTTENTQLAVTFEYKENHFFLRKYGAFDCIPDNWEEPE